jgi:uncharacterized protein (DUF1778 family)
MAYTQRTVRLTKAEMRFLAAASRILGQTVSEFVRGAIHAAAHDLGVHAFLPAPRSRPKPWPYAPVRSRGSTDTRTTLNFDVETNDVLHTAAEYVGVAPHLFAIGAAIRYVHTRENAVPALRALPRPPTE